MKIIAHRGLWKNLSQKNSSQAFKTALASGFGIETDVRDLNGKLVISHDTPNIDSIAYENFVSLVKDYPPVDIAMNIKANELQDLLRQHSYIEGTNLYFLTCQFPTPLDLKSDSRLLYSLS